MAAFNRLAAIVGAFTKHMCDVNTTLSDVGDEYGDICRHMQNCTLQNETGEFLIFCVTEYHIYADSNIL